MIETEPRAKSTATGVVVVCAALMMVGVVMVASAGASLDRSLADGRFWTRPFGRQAIFAVAGFTTILITAALGRRAFNWSRRSWSWGSAVLLLVCLGALVAVLVPGIGTVRNGARRWIEFGASQYGIRFQPSEFAKLAMIVVLAVVLSRPPEKVRSFFRGLLPGALIIAMIAGLVGIEDFGTAVLLAAVGGLMLVAGGCRTWQLALMALPGAAALGHLVVSRPYRVARLVSFLDIWADPRGDGYHPVQSLATIASGGWFGLGLGGGVQKYGYLPESQTDFVFSVICEETGLVGGLVVIALFVVFVWLGARVVLRAPSVLQRMLAFGVVLTVGLQAAMNIAVVTVCAPTKGIALPLVSAGGSGVLFLSAGIGLLVAVAAGGVYGERAVRGVDRFICRSSTWGPAS